MSSQRNASQVSVGKRTSFEGRAMRLASASLLAMICSSPLLAQSTAPASQVPSGPTGAANDQQGAAPGSAPTPQSSADAKTPDYGSEIVVTGTRVAGRSRLDTASPVDVLSVNSLAQQGTTELGAALATVAPSIDFPRPSATDATDAIRPATLRGLSPDQVLVLINNVRAHPSANLNINSTVGRGSAAVDLNTVPTYALERIEVLRDGASAQYGSDAIAGVINLRLRQARSGGAFTITHGFYDTQVDTATDRRHVSGEPTTTIQGWTGIGFGSDGYLTLSGEVLDRSATSRSDKPNANAPAAPGTVAIRGRLGDPNVEQETGFANAGVGIGGDWKLYGWAGYQHRHTSSAAFPRPTSATNAALNQLNLVGYPNGFLPLIDSVSKDLNSAVGVKGILSGWNVDVNASYGRNRIDFRTKNSANFAYGAASPHNFYDGALIFDQLVGNVDLDRSFPVFVSLNVAAGVEVRRESYQILPGEPASYGPPPTGAVPGAAGTAQGFGGFAPVNAINKHRSNGSAYLDLDAQVTDKLKVAAAVRGESYTDFGEVLSGKLSARYDFSHAFALRGTISNGFRAPSLQQQYFTNVSSVITNGVPILTGTFPSIAPVSRALGGKPLEPERSVNISGGAVVRVGGFDFTVDAYSIRLRNQLGLSENISATFSPQVAALLAPYNVSAARFFINGLKTRTRGVDLVGHYRLRSASAGTFDFTAAANFNKTKILFVPTTTSTLSPAPVLFARNRLLTLTEGTPRQKVSGAIDWSKSVWGATARVTYYGDVNQPGTTVAADNHTGKHAITDLEARYQPAKGFQAALGVQNLFDVYPKAVIDANNGTSGVLGFPFYSPFGFNGRYIYGRVGINF